MDRIDEYKLIEAAELTAIRLTETLTKISQLLYDRHNAGQVSSGDGEAQTTNQVVGARGALRRARDRAADVACDLRDARIYASGLRNTEKGTTK